MTDRLKPATEPYGARVQAIFDRLPRSWMPPFRLFTTLARHPTLLERFINGAPAYLRDSHVSLRQREVFLQRVTARCGCEYEWGMRVHYFAEEARLTEAQVSATVHGNAASACWDAADALLIRLADELHERCDVSDDLWSALRPVFDDETILELLVMAGYYRTVGYVANALRLPLEPEVGRPFPKA
ncbi:carboxymuconolactone decarboxylase [Bradyrhizobium sp. CCBAU 051011]|uniref:carboxymuconolactone decarboxylase family protein n=1 Tax=Bradyrhizobium sp. CCBAU 051011 TaxID=858422 RepID=UPI001373BF83|nr:carboxymuconolactone decarboxylase family protein [Bradyrhizobium sp. CCBAU 051011]QHO74526.1 carboxymuconolactone decarboxylase [Bradyrhizobium sp. CCBAU 051011]